MSDQPRTVRHNESKVLERLARGEPLLSVGIRNARTAEIIRIASTAGFSIVWIDLEHSSISIDCAVGAAPIIFAAIDTDVLTAGLNQRAQDWAQRAEDWRKQLPVTSNTDMRPPQC
jgi:hypothetical protein